MRCEVLLFAQLREAVGHDRLSLELSERSTVADALDALCTVHPSIARLRRQLAVAVNERYQPPQAILHDGCVIALIPPVSGG